jgi:FtsH-binding integral membrane protein
MVGPDLGVLGRLPSRTVGTIVGFTLLLTASFVGVTAFLAGETAGVGDRVPFYVLAFAAAFVVAIYRLDDREADGWTVLLAVLGVAGVAGLLIGLAVEGTVYALREPERVVASSVFVYFVAAGLLGTGIGFWGLRHWREFAESPDASDA